MMSTKHVLTVAFIAVGGIAITAGTVAEAQRMMGPGGAFEAHDTDGDGRITAEEIAAARAARIEGLDANGDGLLSAEEIAAHQMRLMQPRIEEQARRMVERLDVDGDGLLSVEEMSADAMPMMGGAPGRGLMRMDTDGDGVVTREEYDTGHTRMREHRGEMRGHHGPRGGAPYGHGPQPDRPAPAQPAE